MTAVTISLELDVPTATTVLKAMAERYRDAYSHALYCNAQVAEYPSLDFLRDGPHGATKAHSDLLRARVELTAAAHAVLKNDDRLQALGGVADRQLVGRARAVLAELACQPVPDVPDVDADTAA